MSEFKIYTYGTKNDFYNDEFIEKINSFIDNYKNNVNTNFIKNGSNDLKEQQQTRIIKYYLIPLSYLIYSYIYQKYYIAQQQHDIIMENKLNYKMYQYFFSHKNPIIKKVNVYFYNLFNMKTLNNKKNIKNNVNSAGNLILPDELNQYVINDIRTGKTKDDLIAFLNEVNKNISDRIELEDDSIYETINNDLDLLLTKVNGFINYIKEVMKEKFDNNFKEANEKLNNYIISSKINVLTANKNNLELQLEDYMGKKKILKKDIDVFNKNITTSIDQIKKINQEKETLLKKYDSESTELTNKITKKDSEYKKINDEINNIEEHFDKLKKKYPKNTNKNKLYTELSRKISVNTNTNIKSDEDFDNLRKEIYENLSKIKQDKKNFLSRIEEIKLKKQNLEKYIFYEKVEGKNKLQNKSQDINKHKEDIQICKNEKNNKLLEIEKLDSNIYKLQEEVKNLEEKLNKSKKDKNKLEEEKKNAESEKDSFNNLVKDINKDTKLNDIITKIFNDNILYTKYKNDYDKLYIQYNDIINSIKLINVNLLNCKKNININIENIEIIEYKTYMINDINKIKEKFVLLNSEKDTQKYIFTINKNKEIILILEEEKNTIKSIFNNKKNQDYYTEYIDYKLNIYTKIMNNSNSNINIDLLINNDNFIIFIIKNYNDVLIKFNIKNILNIKNEIKNEIKKDGSNNNFLLILLLLYSLYSIIEDKESKLLNIIQIIKYMILYEEYNEYIYISEYTKNNSSSITNLIDINEFKNKYYYDKIKNYKKDNININKDELLKLKNKFTNIFKKNENELKILDEEINESNYNSKIQEKKNIINKKNATYTEKKTKKDNATKILNELSIKKGDKNKYESLALSKIKNTNTKEQIKKEIKKYVNNYTKKINNIDNKGNIKKENKPPNNNIVKNEIYRLINDYYENNKSANINSIEKIIKKDKEDKKKLEFEKDIKTKQKDLLTIYSNNYTEYISKIDNILSNIDLDKDNSDQNKKELKNIIDSEFNKLIELSNKIKDIVNKIYYNSTHNKIFYYITNDYLYDHIVLYNEKNYFKTSNLNKFINFLNDYFTENKFYFINKIREIKNNIKEDNEIIHFFNEYINNFEMLVLKINNLLNQINQDNINIRQNPKKNIDDTNNIDNTLFINNEKYINKKIDICNKIINYSKNEITQNGKKGKFTEILPYTDVMFLYIIFLTNIIEIITFKLQLMNIKKYF
jgi:hypothetical protein